MIFLTSVSVVGASLLLYFAFFIPKFSYIKNRLLSFFDSEKGTYNFQSDKAIDSITSGGFFGKGIGEGTLKNKVPEAHTDYIISVISEEFGVIVIILILVLFFFDLFESLLEIIICQCKSLLPSTSITVASLLCPITITFSILRSTIYMK